MSLRIIEEGLQTSIQDSGRPGSQSSGISVSGAMDSKAMKLANIAVGNHAHEAVLEMSYMGPSITFETDMVIALTGADMSAKINDKPLSLGMPLAVKTGDTLQLRTVRTGMHCYLAVKGGFNIPEILGSKSASIKDDLGGEFSRRLKTGDSIPINTPLKSTPFSWRLSPQLFSYIQEEPVVRFIEGRQYHWFTEEARQMFMTESYKTTTQSNRMGYRLEGKRINKNKEEDLVTEAATFGTIQIPPDGNPIILMAESQSTGGYPKIGQVIQADLPVLSQVKPGKSVTFKKVSLDEAINELRKERSEILAVQTSANMKWRELASCTQPT
ncbi:biotin-dependent carboxyltransferase family protein [Sediminibacillus massiliensis]|uniref:5-oxoprolinase subunit C family protein n=1 Tax=Sediminibacillus massiliensis TaxID=1926277 RepID=UPI0009883455|nr:biotin-dependent carboxyltransferase family protein [Sediminibacillus massiliensis]